MCKGKYCWEVGVGEEPWFYYDVHWERVDHIPIENVLGPELVMEKISTNNLPPKNVSDQLITYQWEPNGVKSIYKFARLYFRWNAAS